MLLILWNKKIKKNKKKKKKKKKKIFKINKNIDDGRWSYNEHIKFIEAIVKFGKNWSNIAKYLGTRTPNQVRSHSQKFYFKLRDIKNNELNINFQNRNIKNIFDIIYLIKERKKSNDDENEYVINTLISLTKNLNYNFLQDLYKNKIKEQNKDIINVNKKDVFKNDIKTIEDPEKKIDDSKKIETDINEKLINNNIKENEEQKEEKITLDNNINDISIFKIKVEESEDENVGEEKEESENEKAEKADEKEEAEEEELEEREVEKEEEIPYEYIYTQENQKYIFVDGILFPENALNFSDMINLDYQKRNFM